MEGKLTGCAVRYCRHFVLLQTLCVIADTLCYCRHFMLLQTLCGGQSQHAELPPPVPGLAAELRTPQESLRQRWSARIPGENSERLAH